MIPRAGLELHISAVLNKDFHKEAFSSKMQLAAKSDMSPRGELRIFPCRSTFQVRFIFYLTAR